MKTVFWLILGLMVLPVVAMGQTALYNTTDLAGGAASYDNGDTVVLIGTGFGDKGTAKPYLWADFEEGQLAPHTSLSIHQDFEITDTWMTHYSTGGLNNSGCAKGDGTHPVTNVNFNLGFIIDEGEPYLNEYEKYYYQNYKAYYSHDHEYTSNTQAGFKVFAFQATDESRVLVNSSTSTTSLFNVMYPPDDGGWAQFGMTPRAPAQQWFDREYIFKMNSAATADGNGDGEIHVYTDGDLVFHCPPEGYWVGYAYRYAKFAGTSGGVHHVDRVYIGKSNHQSTWDAGLGDWQDANVTYDNVYVDTTAARVIIANSNVLADADLREPQIPIYWAADGDSIQVVVNTGEHSEDDWAYMYVIAPGAADTSGAYMLQIGGTGYGGGDDPPESVAPCDSVKAWPAQ